MTRRVGLVCRAVSVADTRRPANGSGPTLSVWPLSRPWPSESSKAFDLGPVSIRLSSIRALLAAIALAGAALALAVPGWAGPASKTKRVSVDSSGAQALGGASYNPVLSADGRFVAFYSYATNLVGGDTNGQS